MNDKDSGGGISASFDGDVSGTVNIAGGDIIIHAAPAPPTTLGLLKQALTHLSFADYASLLSTCTQILTAQPDHGEANLLAAIALLRGQGADRLSDSAVQRLEQHLARASESAERVTALALLGILKYDYYAANGLYTSPSFEQVAQSLAEAGIDQVNRDLLRHIKASPTALARIGLA